MCCWIKFKCQDTSFSTTDGTPGRASPGNAHVEAWNDRVTGQKMQKWVFYSILHETNLAEDGKRWQKYVLVVIAFGWHCIVCSSRTPRMWARLKLEHPAAVRPSGHPEKRAVCLAHCSQLSSLIYHDLSREFFILLENLDLKHGDFMWDCSHV